MTSTEPDDLYTLRAQYHLGHYALALEESKAIARKPMSPELKAEREEYVQRAQLGLGEPVSGGDTPGKLSTARSSEGEEKMTIELMLYLTILLTRPQGSWYQIQI
jgi:hypothetical protein